LSVRRLIFIGMLAVPILQSAAAPPAPTPREKAVSAALTSVAETCGKAESPRDLDRLWTELAALKSSAPSGNSDRPENRMLDREIDGAIFFVRQWREYLEAHQLGNKNASYESLKTLLDDSSWLTLVPRSFVLDRYRERFKFYTVGYPTKTIADIPKVIAALQKLERLTDEPDLRKKEIEQLEELLAIDDLRKNGEWEAMEAACRIDPEDPAAICRFKYLILAHAVVGYLGLDGKTKLTPSEKEAAPQFLMRLRQEATQNGDWVALWRLLTYAAHLNRHMPSWEHAQFSALVGYLEGQKSESKGWWFDAAAAYRLALHKNAQPALAQAIAERLHAIQETHPETRFDSGERENYRLGQISAELNRRLRGMAPRDLPGALPSDPSAPDSVPVWRQY